MGSLEPQPQLLLFFRIYTWEYLAYREESRWSTPRDVNHNSLFISDEETAPHTWDTVDWERGSVVCVPHSPDPVLYGIRGDSPFVLPMLFHALDQSHFLGTDSLTNQGTDAHLLEGTIGSLNENSSHRICGTVLHPPITGTGGHVSLVIGNGGKELTCMAFEPTKGFRQLAILIPGDQIIAVGSFLNGHLKS